MRIFKTPNLDQICGEAQAMGYYIEGHEPTIIVSDEDDFTAELWSIDDENVPTDAQTVTQFNQLF